MGGKHDIVLTTLVWTEITFEDIPSPMAPTFPWLGVTIVSTFSEQKPLQLKTQMGVSINGVPLNHPF